jgi:PAS domain S-box-containing protein
MKPKKVLVQQKNSNSKNKIKVALPKTTSIKKGKSSKNSSFSTKKNLKSFFDNDFNKFLKILPGSILIVNDKSTIVDVNKKTLKLTGYSRDELIGRSIRSFIPKHFNNSFKEIWKMFLETAKREGDLILKRKDDREISVEFNSIKKIIPGYNIILLKDITDKREYEKKLIESEERWKFALEGAGDGVWDWNAETNKVYFSSNWKKMLGYSDDEISDSLDEWSSRIHPDDKEKCFSDLQKYFDGETSQYLNEHRMLCKDGSYKWILDRGKIVERTAKGKPLRVIGTHTDIDAQKKIINELEKKNIFIQEILDNLPIGLALNKIDSGQAEYVNKKFSEIYGWTPDKIANISHFFELVYPDPEYRREIQTRVMSDIESGDPERMKWENVKITTSTGEERFVNAANIPIPEQNIMVSTVQDVTQKKVASDLLIQRNESLSAIVDITSILPSSLDFNVTLQSITDNLTNHLEFDSGAIYLVNGNNLFLEATTPPLDPKFPDIFRRALVSEHSYITKAIKHHSPIFLYDSSKVEMLPAERKIIETRQFRSLFYLPIISQNEVIAILIVGTVNRLKHLSEIEIEVCKSLSNISALAISNARLYYKSLQDVAKLEREVEERTKIENALAASEAKFSKAFKINPDIIIITGLEDGVFMEINDGFTKETGYSYEEIIGKSAYEINIWKNPEDRKYFIESLKSKGHIENFESEYVIKDGSLRTGLMSATIIEIGGKKCILSITRNITERKKAEEELRENQRKLSETNQLLQNILDTVPSRIFWKDRNSILLGCNKSFAMDSGKENPEDIIGLSDYEMGWKDQADLYRADDRKVMDSGIAKVNYEEPQTTPNGSLIWLKTSKVPLKDIDGNIIGVLGTYEDITEKKLAEQALIESEERYKSLFNNNHSVMLLINPVNGKIVDANPAACKYYGWSRIELLNKNISEINILSPAEIKIEMENARMEKRNRFFFKHRLANNDIRDVEVFSGAVTINSEDFLYSIVHDITEQKRAEKALLESEEKYRFMFAKNPQPMWIYDLENLNILEVNDAAINHYGYSREEFLNMNLKDIRPVEDIPALIEDVEITKKDLNPSGEWRHIKKDGSVIDVEISSHSVSFNGRPARHVLIKDITERKRFIKQITHSLKEKEVLIREVHHRVKNNFQVIISLLSLQSDLIDDPKLLSAFKESRNRIKSMSLIHELLYRETSFESIDVPHYIQNMVDYLNRSYPESKENISIISEVDNIRLDLDTMIPCGLIINELISNSMKHAFTARSNGKILISFKKNPDNNYCLTVKDNGKGISQEIDLNNLKSLGMMLINTLTKQLNGELLIDRKKIGTEFKITFKGK